MCSDSRTTTNTVLLNSIKQVGGLLDETHAGVWWPFWHLTCETRPEKLAEGASNSMNVQV